MHTDIQDTYIHTYIHTYIRFRRLIMPKNVVKKNDVRERRKKKRRRNETRSMSETVREGDSH